MAQRPPNLRFGRIKRNITILFILFLITAAFLISLIIIHQIQIKRDFDNYNNNVNNQLENYTKFISNNDAGTLKQLIKEFYPVYQGLYTIGYNTIQKNSSLLQIKNQTLVELADIKAKCMPNSNTLCSDRDGGPPYGISDTAELGMRKVVANTVSEFKNKYNNNYIQYSFVATPSCSMYLLEPYASQFKLAIGNYTTHPWCIELKNNYLSGRGYAPETYLTKTTLLPANSVVFPIAINLNNKSQTEFFGLGVDLYQMTLDFFKNHNLPQDNSTKLILISTHTGKTNSVSISEPGYRYPGSYVPVENTPLTSLNKQEQAILKQVVENYDTNSGTKNIKINGKNYYISSTSNNLEVTGNQNNQIDTHYPIIDNRDRGVSWEWVLLRESPSYSNLYLTYEAVIMPSIMLTLIFSIVIGIILISYIIINKSTLRLLR